MALGATKQTYFYGCRTSGGIACVIDELVVFDGVIGAGGIAAVVELLDEVGDESDVEPAADEGVAADVPDVDNAAVDSGVDAAEGAVQIAAREGVGAEVPDDVAIIDGCSRRSPNSGVGQS